jgi:hypothetical protein
LFVREQVLLTATAQNIKRMARLLSQTGPNKKAKGQTLGLKIPRQSLCHFIFRWILSPVQPIGLTLA